MPTRHVAGHESPRRRKQNPHVVDEAADHVSYRFAWQMSLGQLLSWGSIYYSFSVLIEPISVDTGWSYSSIAGAFSLGLLIAALTAPIIGKCLDRGSARGVLAGGALLAAALLYAWTYTSGLLAFYLVWAGLGLCMAATLYEPAFAVLVRRYRHNSQRAIARVTLVGGFASTVFVPFLHMLIEHSGWRTALVVLAGINLFVAFLYLWIVPRVDSRIDNETRSSREPLTFRRILRFPHFWWLALSFTCSGFIFAAVAAHMVPLMKSSGGSSSFAIFAIALIGPSQVLARFALLVTRKVLSAGLLGAISTWSLAASVVILFFSDHVTLLLVMFAVLYGFSNGLTTLLRGSAVLEYFGSERYGTIAGMLALPATYAKAVAPLAVALLWTQPDGFDNVMALLFVLALFAAVAIHAAKAAAVGASDMNAGGPLNEYP